LFRISMILADHFNTPLFTSSTLRKTHSIFYFQLYAESNESRMIMYDLYLAQESYIEALR